MTGLEGYCPICGRSRARPYRVYDAEHNVIEGCVDEFHEPALPDMSLESRAWHDSEHAQAVRHQLRALREGVESVA